MTEFIGRKKEQQILQEMWNSKEANFAAIVGRRRIGKTYLINEYFKDKGVFFEVTGVKDGNMHDQLTNFTRNFEEVFYPSLSLSRPKDWRKAFEMLTEEAGKTRKKIVVFFDELPWLATKRSRLLQHLEYFWNTKWKKLPNFKLIVCGSAASWMLNKIINAKGGLHNRITHTILLKPFTLLETKQFLKSKQIILNNKQVLDLYMVTGGVPFYLKKLKKAKSVNQNINDLCFKEDGLLYNEFTNLFKSLFNAAKVNLQIIRKLAKYRNGVSIKAFAAQLKRTAGGRLYERFEELEAAGFICQYLPYGKRKRDHYCKIIDEYTLFYLNWIEPIRHMLPQNPNLYWQSVVKSQSWLSWAGYAFEAVCYKHSDKIIKALGLNSINCLVGTWQFIPRKGSKQKGAQIDLVIERADDAITLCEIKYSNQKFAIDKVYARNLVNKMEVFEQHFSTNKQIFMTIITTIGLKHNLWSDDLISGQVTLDDLLTPTA